MPKSLQNLFSLLSIVVYIFFQLFLAVHLRKKYYFRTDFPPKIACFWNNFIGCRGHVIRYMANAAILHLTPSLRRICRTPNAERRTPIPIREHLNRLDSRNTYKVLGTDSRILDLGGISKMTLANIVLYHITRKCAYCPSI